MEDFHPLNRANKIVDWAKDPVLKQAVEALAEVFQLEKVFLFGSRAKGDHSQDSDYDLLLVVEDTEEDRFMRELKGLALVRHLDASFDLFIYTKSEFDNWKNELSSIPETAMNTGRELQLG